MLSLIVTAVVCLVLGALFSEAVGTVLSFVIYYGLYPYWKAKERNANLTVSEKMDKVLKRPKWYLYMHNRKKNTDDQIDMDELVRRVKLSKYFNKYYAMMTSTEKTTVID